MLPPSTHHPSPNLPRHATSVCAAAVWHPSPPPTPPTPPPRRGAKPTPGQEQVVTLLTELSPGEHGDELGDEMAAHRRQQDGDEVRVRGSRRRPACLPVYVCV